jgi:hypothetical protein
LDINVTIKYYIMLKNILNLEGAQKLTKNEQKKINGGLCEGQWIQCGMTQLDCTSEGGRYRSNGCCLLGPC